MRALVPAILATLLLAGCSSALPTTSPTSVPSVPTPTVEVISTPRPTPEPTPSPTPQATHAPAEADYLAALDEALAGTDWRDTYEYLGADGQATMWLDMGYAVCGLYAADWSSADVVDFLAPNYTNPRLYPEGFAAVLAAAAEDRLCSA